MAPKTGRHIAAIELVGISDDGRAAISQDITGGSRLWPTLDGSREPVIISLPRAIDLVVGQALGGFVVATRDEAGGIAIIALDRDGRVVTREHIAPEPRIAQVMVANGLVLARRDDQMIVVYAPNGRERDRLVPPPGTRITSLVARGGRALALVQTDAVASSGLPATIVRGSWIEGDKWGASTPPLSMPEHARPEAAALAPHAMQLAVPGIAEVALIDLSTGAIERRITTQHAAHVGWIGDGKLGVASETNVTQWVVDDKVDERAGLGHPFVEPRPPAPARFGDGVMLSALDHQLELRTPAGQRFLGYRVGNPAGVRLLADRAIVSGTQSHVVEVGTDLQQRAELDLPNEPGTVVDLQWLDARHVLVAHSLLQTSPASLSVVDLDAGITVQRLTMPSLQASQRFQRATNLLAITDTTSSYLVRYDPKAARFETWLRVGDAPADVHVLDPALTDGVVALDIRRDTLDHQVFVERIRASDLVVGQPVIGETRQYKGTFGAVDARGRVYMLRGDDLYGYDGEREVLRIASVGASSAPERISPTKVVVAPHALATLSVGEVTVYDLDGRQRWRTMQPSVVDIGWMGETLVGRFTSGLATFDRTTGALETKACGWSFGLSNDPPTEPPSNEESICDLP